MGIVFFVFVIILFSVLGILPYEKNIKECLMKIYTIIYNLIFGLYDTFLFNACVFLGNKISDVFIFFMVYALLLIPINIVFKIRGKINIKRYLITSFISTVIGIVLYYLIVLIGKKLGLPYIFSRWLML